MNVWETLYVLCLYSPRVNSVNLSSSFYPQITLKSYTYHLMHFLKSQETNNSVVDEFRSLKSWGVKLLCSLVMRWKILLYLLSDGSGLNRLWLWLVSSFIIFRIRADIALHRCHWCSVDGTKHAGLWYHALALYASTSIVAVFGRMSLSDTSAVCWPTLKSLWPVRASTYLHMIAFICLMTSRPFWIQASKQIDLFVAVCVCVCVCVGENTHTRQRTCVCVCEWERDSVCVCEWRAEGAALEAAQVL